MKILLIAMCIIFPVVPMDLTEINKIIMQEENSKCIFDYERKVPLIDMNKNHDHTIEITQNIHIPHEHEETSKCCSCSKSKALIVGSIVAAGSVVVVSVITGVITIIVAVINNK